MHSPSVLRLAFKRLWRDARAGELRLLLHAETEGDLPFASVDIIVKTVMGEDETTYDGDYRMFVHRAEGEGVERSGKVSCSVG